MRARRPFALCGTTALLVATPASANFIGILADTYQGGDDRPEWIANGYFDAMLETWRIYAWFTPGDTNGVTAVFGIDGLPLSLNTTGGSYYNDEIFGTDTAPLDLRDEGIWSNQWDSYVTLGRSQAPSATQLAPGFNTLTGGLSHDWSSENTGWFVTPDEAESVPPPDGLQLLAQISMPWGTVPFGMLNVQLRDGKQFTRMEFAVPGTAGVVMLGLAGLSGTRRRRR